MLVIKQALNYGLIEKTRCIFKEYADYLSISLDFQNFDKELRNLHKSYASPEGCILLAFYDKKLVGCVALKKFQDDICEMKRLYIRSKYRNRKIGYNLCHEVILKAKQIGYKCMRLDTLPFMKEAMNLYSKLGFKEIDPYRLNPIKGAKFYELLL